MEYANYSPCCYALVWLDNQPKAKQNRQRAERGDAERIADVANRAALSAIVKTSQSANTSQRGLGSYVDTNPFDRLLNHSLGPLPRR